MKLPVILNPSRGESMPAKTRRRTRRKSTTRKNLSYSARRNPAKKKTTRKKATRGRHRPVVYKTASGWKRSPNSTLFPEPVRLNPRRRRKVRKAARRFIGARKRRYTRRNPVKRFGSRIIDQKLIMQGFSLAGGFAGGALLMPVIYNFSPQVIKSNRRFMGIIHIILGTLTVSNIKHAAGKNIGAGIIASGAYDLIAQNIPQLQLHSLPTQSGALLGLVGPKTGATPTTQDAPDETTSGSMGLSYSGRRARMGLSYYEKQPQTVGSSYSPSQDVVPVGCDTPFDGMLE